MSPPKYTACKNSDPKTCTTFAKHSIEFEQSLRNLDNILGGTECPADESNAYSKFSSELEDLGERIRRLNESLGFFEDEYTKEDWKYFMRQDLERLKESIETCEKFISVLGVAKGTLEIKHES
jgi:predicted nuclease with TOPRIM domain